MIVQVCPSVNFFNRSMLIACSACLLNIIHLAWSEIYSNKSIPMVSCVRDISQDLLRNQCIMFEQNVTILHERLDCIYICHKLKKICAGKRKILPQASCRSPSLAPCKNINFEDSFDPMRVHPTHPTFHPQYNTCPVSRRVYLPTPLYTD